MSQAIPLFIIDSKSASYMGNEKALHMLDPLDLSLSLFAQEGRNTDMEDLRPSASIWHGLHAVWSRLSITPVKKGLMGKLDRSAGAD